MNTDVGDLPKWAVELFPIEKLNPNKVLTVVVWLDLEPVNQRTPLKVVEESGHAPQALIVRHSLLERERDVVVNHGMVWTLVGTRVFLLISERHERIDTGATPRWQARTQDRDSGDARPQ